MGLLTESTARFFARIFGTTPPTEEIGTTLAGNPSDRAGRPAWAWWIVLTLMSGGLLSMVVVIEVINPPRGVNLPPLPPVLVHNPCTVLADRRWPELQERLHWEPLPRTDETLQDKVDAAFEPIYARIPKFLDWHYSFAGQYTQLAQVILDWLESEIAPAIRDRLLESQLAPQAVLDRLGRETIDRLQDSEGVRAALDRLQQEVDDRLQQEVESRLFGDLRDRVENASAHVERVMKDEMRALVEETIRTEARTLLDPAYAETWTTCMDRNTYERMLTAAIPETVRRFTNSAGPTGVIAVGAAYRGAVAARALIRGLNSRLLSRLLGGRIAAAIGGGLAGLVAWLLVDGVVLSADEYFNRDDLEAELKALIDEQKAEVKAALSEAVAEEKSEALGVFLPSELGARRRSP